MRIVSENSEQDLARQRAERTARAAVRQLTANLIRVTRGAGKPHEIGRQAVALLEAMQAHWDAARFWPFDEMADALQMDERPKWPPNADPEEVNRHYAEQMIVAGALQVVASRLVGQATQQRAGEAELHRGVREMERISDERRKKRAAVALAARKGTAAGRAVKARRKRSTTKPKDR